MASWAFIGVIVGLLLGLTGAGGAVIAVPLFVQLTNASIREATVLSLAAVSSGALLNWLIQRRNTETRIGLLLFAFSLIGSFAFKPLKSTAPEWLILCLFAIVVTLSLSSVWRHRMQPSTYQRESNVMKLVTKSALGGFILGALVTMTGLGGGVILVPLLTGFYGLTLSRAAATSLFTVILTSMTSLGLQWNLLEGQVSASEILVLAAGSVVSAILTRKLLIGIPLQRIDDIRRIVITIVILFSIISLLIHSL